MNYAIYIKNNGTRTNSSNWTFKASYDGVDVYNASGRQVITNDVASSGGVKKLFEGSFDVYHNTGGDKTINFSASISKGSYTQWDPGSCSLSGNFTLTTIPREANFTYNYLENVAGYNGLHGIRVLWGADSTCDWVRYSLNGGAWTDAGGQDFVIWGLNPATTYSIRLSIRRADSQLWTESKTMWGTTRDINRITSGTPNVSNGSSLRVTASSNSGANCRIRIECGGASRLSKNGTDVTFSVAEIESLMQYSPNNASFTIRVVADTLDNNGNATYYHWNDGTYTINNSNPIFNDFNFEDINPTTVALTGNNQDCIIGHSNIKVTIPSSMKATAQNYATMNKYRFTCGTASNDAEYVSSEDVTITLNNVISSVYSVFAIDSRNCVTQVDRLANNVINYTNIQKDSEISCIRVDSQGHHTGVSELVQLSFSGKIWKGNFGVQENSITSATYRYTDAQTGQWVNGVTTITPTVDANGNFEFVGLIRGDSNLGFEINNSYNLEIYVTDKLSMVKYTASLSSGKPHVAYAKNGIGLMGKYDEDVGGIVQADGRIIFPDSTKYSLEENTSSTMEVGDPRGYYFEFEKLEVGQYNGKPLYRVVVHVVEEDSEFRSLFSNSSMSAAQPYVDFRLYNSFDYLRVEYAQVRFSNGSGLMITLDNNYYLDNGDFFNVYRRAGAYENIRVKMGSVEYDDIDYIEFSLLFTESD